MALATKGYWIQRTATLNYNEIKYDLQVQQGPEKGLPNQNATSMGVEGGLIEWNKFYVEAGGDWLEPTTGDILYGIVANVKFSYQNVALDGWAVSLGAENFALSPGQHDDNIIYTVFEASVGPEWTLAMGGYTGHEARLLTATGAMVGAWYKIQSGKGDVGLEWMSGQSKLGYVVPGIRLSVRDGVEAILAYGIAGDRETYRDLFLTRITVYF